jgi:hypothetical protein
MGMKKVGILAGRERSFPNALIERVAARNAGVEAEWIKLGGTSLDSHNPYSVIVDRISHEVPYYATYLRQAQQQGVYVINNPFIRSAEDKFTANDMALKLGVRVPKTIVLPNKEHIADISPESLSNLHYPLDWGWITGFIGFPAVLKPADGGGWKAVSIVQNTAEMLAAYDRSGQLTMIVQEFIHWDRYVRCLCIGRSKVLTMAWDPNKPHNERYLNIPDYLSPELGTLIMKQSLTLCQGLGYDMNTVEFAIRDEVPYAIDFTNAAPDMDISSLGPWHFNWTVNAMTDLVIEKSLAAPYRVDARYGAAPQTGY